VADQCIYSAFLKLHYALDVAFVAFISFVGFKVLKVCKMNTTTWFARGKQILGL
jgi:hypothetical protein